MIGVTSLGRRDAPGLALVPGWGMDAGIFLPLAERLSERFHIYLPNLPGHGASRPYALSDRPLDTWAEALTEAVPEPVAWLGWSLGGMLALRIAAHHPQRVTALILLAATPRFVSGKDWPHGVDPEVLADFRAALAADPAKTLNRFAALQVRGDLRAGQQLRMLRKHLAAAPPPDARALTDGLRILAEADLRADWAGIRQPALAILGAEDRLTTAAGGAAMQRLNPNLHMDVFPKTAHLPFLSQAERLASKLINFLDFFIEERYASSGRAEDYSVQVPPSGRSK